MYTRRNEKGKTKKLYKIVCHEKSEIIHSDNWSESLFAVTLDELSTRNKSAPSDTLQLSTTLKVLEKLVRLKLKGQIYNLKHFQTIKNKRGYLLVNTLFDFVSKTEEIKNEQS